MKFQDPSSWIKSDSRHKTRLTHTHIHTHAQTHGRTRQKQYAPYVLWPRSGYFIQSRQYKQWIDMDT